MKEIKKILFLLFFILILFSLECRLNTFHVNIDRNFYGIDPRDYVCSYDDIAKKVTCMPIDPSQHRQHVIPNVYTRRLTSDPPGINFIGTIANPHINPGFITEYTSTRPYFELYSSKY